VLIPLTAGALSALCLWFSWRALARCRAIEQGTAGDAVSPSEDELERELLARERSLQLGLAKRNVQALGRAALFGGTGLSFLAFTGGGEYHLRALVPAGLSFAVGMFGWAGCAEIHRRVGSLADAWRGRRRATTRSGPV
jgi:hypothetical protein